MNKWCQQIKYKVRKRSELQKTYLYYGKKMRRIFIALTVQTMVINLKLLTNVSCVLAYGIITQTRAGPPTSRVHPPQVLPHAEKVPSAPPRGIYPAITHPRRGTTR